MPKSATCGRLRSPPKASRKKNGRSDPQTSHARSRATAANRFPGAAQDRASRSRSRRDGGTLGHAPCRRRRFERTAGFSQPGPGRSHVRCACGQAARYRELRCKTVLTAVGPVQVSRPYYRCPHCHTGQFPVDVELDIARTEFSGVRRMQALVGQQTPFAHGHSYVAHPSSRRRSLSEALLGPALDGHTALRYSFLRR